MKCAVIVMATLMIIASMLLVGVSLAMAEHIDELGNSQRNTWNVEIQGRPAIADTPARCYHKRLSRCIYEQRGFYVNPQLIAHAKKEGIRPR